MESCYKRIQQAMSLRDLKQVDLCEITGIDKSSMSKYVNGVFVPKQKATYLIAKALRVNEAWLMGYNVPMDRTDDSSSAPAADPLHKKIDRLDDVDKIRAEAYVDGLLSADKYQKNISAGTA